MDLVEIDDDFVEFLVLAVVHQIIIAIRDQGIVIDRIILHALAHRFGVGKTLAGIRIERQTVSGMILLRILMDRLLADERIIHEQQRKNKDCHDRQQQYQI